MIFNGKGRITDKTTIPNRGTGLEVFDAAVVIRTNNGKTIQNRGAIDLRSRICTIVNHASSGIALKQADVVCPITLHQARFRSGKTTINFHPRFQFHLGAIRNVGPTRNPDFRTAVTRGHSGLQRGVGIGPINAILSSGGISLYVNGGSGRYVEEIT